MGLDSKAVGYMVFNLLSSVSIVFVNKVRQPRVFAARTVSSAGAPRCSLSFMLPLITFFSPPAPPV